jgi:periplasmic protein TonB
MLNLLLESKRKKKRSFSGTLFSVVLHSTILFLAIFATARAGGIKSEHVKAEKIAFVDVKKKDEPPPPKEEKKPDPPQVKKVQQPKVVNLPQLPKEVPVAPPKGFKVLEAPVSISVNIPKIDLSAKLTDASDFTGKGVRGGTGSGVAGGTGDADSKGTVGGDVDLNKIFKESEVESPAEKIGGPTPEYPESLRSSGIEGEVMVQFVVNASGRYEPGTLRVIQSSNPAFTAAVKAALPEMRCSAARVGGRRVQQLVQLPFEFHLNK